MTLKTTALPLWAKRVLWKLQGKSGRTIGWRIALEKKRYDVGVGIAVRLCRGNRYGDHTPLWPAKQPLGGSCLCARTRQRLDYIPF